MSSTNLSMRPYSTQSLHSSISSSSTSYTSSLSHQESISSRILMTNSLAPIYTLTVRLMNARLEVEIMIHAKSNIIRRLIKSSTLINFSDNSPPFLKTYRSKHEGGSLANASSYISFCTHHLYCMVLLD